MYRRSLLASLPALFVALVGCAQTGGPAVVAAQTATDVKLIADAFLPLATTIAGMAGATPQIVAAVADDVAKLEVAAGAVAPGVANAVAAPSVATIGSAVQSVLSALAGLTLPTSVMQVLQAAQVLLPLIEAAVGTAVMVGARPGGLQPAQARVVLAVGARR